jgi:two-component system, NtrC family, response regulator HydG
VRPLDEVEKDYILAALELNGGNQTHTAAQLRIGTATLYRKLKGYGLIGRKRATRRRSSR